MAQTTRRRSSAEARRRSACLSATTAVLSATVHPHELPGLAPGVKPVTEDAGGGEGRSIRSAYRLLMIRGLSSTEAGNVVAYIAGLHATEGGWTVRQIEQLVALRSLAACGVISS